MSVSIIIPTYNRAESLQRTLSSLARQTYPMDCFDVTVVDDGSTDGTPAVVEQRFPFALRYVRQANQGDAAARNNGALHSGADVLVFVDDDITVVPEFVASLVQVLDGHDHTIVVGNLLPVPKQESIFQKARVSQSADDEGEKIIDFAQCLSGFFAVKRADYFDIGMMRGLAGQGPDAWCDVDFAYRAYLLDFRFKRSLGAIGYHYDAAAASLDASCRRWERASRLVVPLFQRDPGLQQHLPMFRDKSPISLRRDPPRLSVRKVGRAITACRPVLWGMEQLIHFLERVAPQPGLLRPLYRWTISSYVYRGYRQGLREYGPAPVGGQP